MELAAPLPAGGVGLGAEGLGQGQEQGELWDLGLSCWKRGNSDLEANSWQYNWDPAPGFSFLEVSPPVFSLAKPPIHNLGGFLEFP